MQVSFEQHPHPRVAAHSKTKPPKTEPPKPKVGRNRIVVPPAKGVARAKI